jgi:arginase family enzyme
VIPPGLQPQVDGPAYLGPGTFLKAPALHDRADLDRHHPDVAIVGAPWHLMGELLDRGTGVVVREAIAQALDGPEFIYLSLDIDVLDPGFASGTGTPEPGGMNPAELLRAIRSVVLSTNVIAMDVVEVSPPYDHAELTAQNAHRAILEALSALAVKARDKVPPSKQQTHPKE